MKSTNPNLSLREAWRLYKILPKDENVLDMLEGLSPEVFVESLRLMYKKVSKNKMTTHFLKGLEKCEYFSFVEFVKEIKG